MTRLAWFAAAVTLALSTLAGVQAVDVFAAVGSCGSSGSVKTTAACYRVGERASLLQSSRWPRRAASWVATCPLAGTCPYTITFRRAGYPAIRCRGHASVTGASGDWRKRRVFLSDRC
jgi:hypothetical protein